LEHFVNSMNTSAYFKDLLTYVSAPELCDAYDSQGAPSSSV
jgi:hypothetical protein